jgi:hypothetical protein
MDDIWTTADMPEVTHDPERGKSRDQATRKKVVTGEELLEFQEKCSGYQEKSATLDFLLHQNLVANTTPELEEAVDALHSQLEEIWNQLGFTIHQKLGLMLKYSENVDESGKLGNSLQFWDQALTHAKTYDTVYRTYKSEIKLQKMGMGQGEMALDVLSRELTDAENGLRRVAKTLKEAFGDDLIVKKRKAEDMILEKRKRLQYMRWG